MTNTWFWNPDFIVYDNTGTQLILKNDRNGALISLSTAEYDLLQAYSQENGYHYVVEKMSDYRIETDLYHAIIEKAQSLNILVQEREKRRIKRMGQLRMKLYYLGNLVVALLSFLTRRPIVAEYSGDLRFFKFFSVDLNGSFLYKLATHRLTQKWYFIVYGGLCISLLICPWVIPHAPFQFSGFGIEHVPIFRLFICLIISIFCFLFIHEMGHYFIYKRFHGIGDKVGLGTMYAVFPVLYTQIDQVCLWNGRKDKLLLSIAGVMMDFLILLILFNVLSFYHEPNFVSLLADCLFYYYIVQIFTNLNFFSPGTDGYYLVEDFFNIERLYGKSYDVSKAFWQEIKQWNLGAKNFKEVLLIAYFCLSCICVTCYWFLITLILTFPIWSNFIY